MAEHVDLLGAEGLRLVADVYGPADGPPALLLHGFGQTRQSSPKLRRENIIERAVILCDGVTFSVDESWLRQESGPASGPVVRLVPTLAEGERPMIEAALAQSNGRISGPMAAARRLGIPSQTLDRRILSLCIDRNRFKTARHLSRYLSHSEHGAVSADEARPWACGASS